MIRWIAVAALVAVAVAGLVRHGGARVSGPSSGADVGRGQRVAARVTRVVDGDTIKVRIAGRRDTVRYIGMDTPESVKPGSPVECFAKAANARNSELIAGREVTLVTDAEARDRYGRLLAYVYRAPDGLFVNAELVRGGFARILTIPPNISHARELRRLQRIARAAGAGLWGKCP
jgi:micrococcal nuclease